MFEKSIVNLIDPVQKKKYAIINVKKTVFLIIFKKQNYTNICLLSITRSNKQIIVLTKMRFYYLNVIRNALVKVSVK